MTPSCSRTQPNQPGNSGTTAIRRRNGVACRRCRRLRAKCKHQSRNPPCEACKLAGPKTAADCYFPRRGEKDIDRQFRSRRVSPDVVPSPEANTAHSHSAANGDPNSMSPHVPKPQDCSVTTQLHRGLIPTEVFRFEDVLPPLSEVVEGCRTFVTSYFQLGFIPKAIFLEDLSSNPSSINTFLLACILSISARFTPSLARRYGNPRTATTYFLDLAMAMVPTEMYKPSLERIQAFFLLAIAQWGNGDRDRSSMDMGAAVRMAGLLKLHCEESYILGKDCPAEEVVRSESARRVFWMIQSQENLHSGYNTPAPFPLDDITTLLPCDEADFAFGVIPHERAALAGTPPALANAALVHSNTRCLFATLVQAHSLWGKVARRAGRTSSSFNRAAPWEENSDHQRTMSELKHWEENIPPRHAFSVWNLRGWKSEGLHLAYLSITMVSRLSRIVSGRIYLENILAGLMTTQLCNSPDSKLPNTDGNAPPGFWEKTSHELFTNVWKLYEQIEAFFTMRSPTEGFPQILVFCVYITGSLATYLWRNPALCPTLAERAGEVAQRALAILNELHVAWPTSSKWQKGLQQITTPSTVVSPFQGDMDATEASSKEQAPQHSVTQSEIQSLLEVDQPQALVCNNSDVSAEVNPRIPLTPSGTNSVPAQEPFEPPTAFARQDVSSFPYFDVGSVRNILSPRFFDAELDAFLQVGFHFDHLGNWGVRGYEST